MKILAFPKDANPYQELLYSPMRSAETKIEYLDPNVPSFSFSLLLLIPQLVFYRAQGFHIFHLHWLYPFQFPLTGKIQQNFIVRLFFTLLAIIFLISIRVLGYKLVWTVHNITPHKNQFINDLLMTKLLVKVSHLLIVHSNESLLEMQKADIPTTKAKIIPMGNFTSVYPNTITKDNARENLKINNKSFVYLFFGKVEKYKGVEELITSYKKIARKNTNLIIAGECRDPELKKSIKQLTKNDNSISTYLHFIPDKEIEIFFNSSDITVFPFQKITTSSSIMLASVFKKASICPKIGNLKEYPNDSIIFYDPKSEQSLEKALLFTLTNKQILNGIGQNAYKFVSTFTWPKVAKKTTTVFKNL